MPLDTGTRLGSEIPVPTQQIIAHYRITSKFGEGGMGAVYRATDTKLNRDVAIKVLPDTFAQDPDRLTRFTREAQVLAALNHPNIAAIYGVEERALVLELVPGQTLAERIAQGPLALDEALSIANQIGEALEYAHEKGIVHRDLKPANIKVTPEGRVKVLDFGLAKALSNEPATADPAASPSVTMDASALGTILGTAAYMAPEQARGQRVDKRADIWAFGAVLYEMLTQRQVFGGATVSDCLSAVLTKEPDWDRVPAKAQRLLRACLEKRLDRRLRDIGDASLLLEDTGPALAAKSRVSWTLSIALLAAAVLAAVLGIAAWRAPRSSGQAAVTLDLDLGAAASPSSVGPAAILSPDGSRVVFVSHASDGVARLYTRRLDRSAAADLRGTDGAYDPFFSPDGQWVGFFAKGKLKKVRIDGGDPVLLCDAPAGRGGTWSENNTIIAALDSNVGLVQVSGDGGETASIVTLNGQAGEYSHRWPQAIPGGKAVLFQVGYSGGNYEAGSIALLSLADRRKKVVIERAGMYPRYIPGGYLTYVSKGTLFAVRFDPDRLEVLGPAKALLDGIANQPAFGFAQIDISRNGWLLYRKGRTEGLRTLAWLDRAGRTEPLIAEPGEYAVPRVSPDGSRISMMIDGASASVWVYDLKRGTRIRLPLGSKAYNNPVWSSDGRYLILQGAGGMYWARSDGAREPQLLTKGLQLPGSMSADGKRLAFSDLNPADTVIRTIPIHDKSGEPVAGEPEFFLKAKLGSVFPVFSPDGRWLAYTDSESGANEIYVRAFPDRGAKWQISNSGGVVPVWSRIRRELFYRTEDNRIMVVRYSVNGGSFVPEKPVLWTQKQLANVGLSTNFDLAPDGDRFVALLPADAPEPQETLSHTMLVLNFADEMKRRMK